MRISPLFNAFVYFLIGSVFVYFAYQSIEDTVLNGITILLTIVASLEYGASIRLIKLHRRMKQQNNQTKK
ncbi:protein of unknown function [Pelagirhabdus alkalitolerans]|uniref:DUF4305 domain-containing protein n=1 Tax=Pelagirhabdus alkalitolerans TaxID=1612202 RepID=A0A1G6J2I1_9BACI|nr:YdiK family protein [Pelagirhabdus alkalitolerans]SDC12860.1 protein of unknown function [Pelagirhabdus alkalitolerans]